VLGIEKSYTFIKSDLLDGQRWQEYAYGDAVLSRDFDNLRFTSINLTYLF
jgi:OmpA-OmpF porin, OOP family